MVTQHFRTVASLDIGVAALTVACFLSACEHSLPTEINSVRVDKDRLESVSDNPDSILQAASTDLGDVGTAPDDQRPNTPRKGELESAVWSTLVSSGMSFTSIQSVECNEFECEIRLYGADDLARLPSALFLAGRDKSGWPLFKQGRGGRDPDTDVFTWRVSTKCPSTDLYVGPRCPE